MQLKLSNESQTTVIDLLGGPFRLRDGFDLGTAGQSGSFTYEPYGAQWDFTGFQPQTEAFDLGLAGTRDNVLAAMNDLQDFLESIRLFHEADLAAESCWLEWAADGEQPKRALLYGGSFKAVSMDNVTPGLEECTLVGVLALTRHPLWENIAYSIDNLDIGVNPLAILYTANNHPGNTLSRNAWFNFYAPVAGPTYYRVWAGIRRYNMGTANFEHVWEATDGTNVSADCSTQADAGASGGTAKQVTFAVAGLVSRMTITVGQVCVANGHTDYDHQMGRYLVLCRCRVTAGTARLQLHWGYTGNYICEDVFVDNTNYRLIPIGNISIPPWTDTENAYGGLDYCSSFGLDIYAESLVAGTLYLDQFILIPNEHLLTVEGAGIVRNGQQGVAEVLANDTERCYGYNVGTSVVDDSLDYAMTDWYWPPGEGVMVIAGEDVDHHGLAEQIGCGLVFYPRWTLYRGV